MIQIFQVVKQKYVSDSFKNVDLPCKQHQFNVNTYLLSEWLKDQYIIWSQTASTKILHKLICSEATEDTVLCASQLVVEQIHFVNACLFHIVAADWLIKESNYLNNRRAGVCSVTKLSTSYKTMPVWDHSQPWTELRGKSVKHFTKFLSRESQSQLLEIIN